MYEILGRIFLLLILGFSSMFFLVILLSIISYKYNKQIFPKFLLFFIDNFTNILKRIIKILGLNEKIIYEIAIELRNKINMEKFKKIPPKDKIIVLPQCIRNVNCPARLDPKTGIICKKCGLCVFKDIKEIAEKYGYKIFLVPGGRFVERIILSIKPKAAVGVACLKDLYKAMKEVSKHGIITIGIPLIKEGCVETLFNVNELIKLITNTEYKRICN